MPIIRSFFIALSLAPVAATAVDGALDPEFAGGTGVLYRSYDFIGNEVVDEIARGIAIGTDQRITVVGDFQHVPAGDGRDCGLLRALPNGDGYDASFMPALGYGYYQFNLGGANDDICHAIALDGSGGGYFVGSATTGVETRAGLIVRFGPNGAPNTGFFGDGIFFTHIDAASTVGAEDADLRQVFIDRVGRVVVSGEATVLTEDGLAARGVVLRFNTDGTPDTSFFAGSSVAALYNAADGSTLHINASAEAADGGYWFAGYRDGGATTSQGRLFRITPQGAFDAQAGGAAGLSVPQCIQLQSMALDDAGRVLLGCLPTDSNRLPGVLRLVRNGGAWIADPSFGTNGYSELRVSAADEPGLWPGVTRIAAVRANAGRILVAGAYDPGRLLDNPSDVVVARLRDDGHKDETFGASGITRLGFGPGADQHYDAATALTLDASARPLVVGQRYATGGGGSSYFLARLQQQPDLLLRDSFESF